MKKLILMLMLFMPLATFAQKFGHVNAQEIMQSMPEFIKARGEVEAAAKQYDNDLKAMQDELQRKAQDYDKNASTMNETKKKETEESLQQMYQKIQQTAQDNQQALGKLQQDKIGPITNKLVEAIKAVGKAGGYVYIMDVTSGIPYISDTLSKDVTAEVKEGVCLCLLQKSLRLVLEVDVLLHHLLEFSLALAQDGRHEVFLYVEKLFVFAVELVFSALHLCVVLLSQIVDAALCHDIVGH